MPEESLRERVALQATPVAAAVTCMPRRWPRAVERRSMAIFMAYVASVRGATEGRSACYATRIRGECMQACGRSRARCARAY